VGVGCLPSALRRTRDRCPAVTGTSAASVRCNPRCEPSSPTTCKRRSSRLPKRTSGYLEPTTTSARQTPRCRGARHSVPGQTGVQETASLTLSDATVEASFDHSRDLLSQHDGNPILSGDRPGMRGKRNSAAGGVCKFLASAWPERARIPLTGGRRIGLVARGKESGHRSAHGTAANERLVA
jgi:hypothetical protein